MSRYQAGLSAERVAGWLLQLKGYRILARRLRTPGGEIDLLARRGNTLVVVEVKQRPGLNNAASAIAPTQQNRLRSALRFVLAQRPELSQHGTRFDAVLVNRWGWPRHVMSAFDDTP